MTAQLFEVQTDGTLASPFPATTFRTNSTRAEYYLVPLNLLAGDFGEDTNVTYRLRAWEGTDWESATLRGESDDIVVHFPAWKATGGVPTVEYLTGLKGFMLHPRITLQLPVPTSNATLATTAKQEPEPLILQTSSNLMDWQNFATNAPTQGVVRFDIFASDEHRFYRVFAE